MVDNNGRQANGTDGVAVVGLGNIGIGLALSLRRAGFDVVGCDLRAERMAVLTAAGGRSAATPSEAARSARIVLSAVVNAQQTEAVLFGPEGVAQSLAEGGVFVSCATMNPDAAKGLAERLEEAGKPLYLDAPVSGGRQRAADGQLTVLASGKQGAFRAAREVLGAVSSKVYELGESPGQASAFKMVNQLLAGVHIAAAGEAMAFAARHGLDLQKVYDVIVASAGNSWMFENRVPHLLEGDYAPRSSVDIFVKDLGIIEDMARTAKFPVPVAAAALQMFLMASGAGMGAEDDISVARVYAQITSTPLPGKVSV